MFGCMSASSLVYFLPRLSSQGRSSRTVVHSLAVCSPSFFCSLGVSSSLVFGTFRYLVTWMSSPTASFDAPRIPCCHSLPSWPAFVVTSRLNQVLLIYVSILSESHVHLNSYCDHAVDSWLRRRRGPQHPIPVRRLRRVLLHLRNAPSFNPYC